jgi:RND family efflux transporter MFP subunit
MKRISLYVILLILSGGLFISFWIYQKYFKKDLPQNILFTVKRGDIDEIVKARGEVASEKEFDLEFPFSGKVENILAGEGERVSQGQPLMKLETIDFELDARGLKAELAEKEASLAKLMAGPTAQDIKVYEIKVANAEAGLREAEKNIVDKLEDAYTKSDDAVRNKVDQLFDNPKTYNPRFRYVIIDSQLKNNIEATRVEAENLLTSWKLSLDSLGSPRDLAPAISQAKNNLNKLKSFLADLAQAASLLISGNSLSQTAIDGYKTDISTGRANINTVITNLVVSEEKAKTAESSLALSKSELELKKAPSRGEDVEIAEAQIEAIKSQLEKTKEKIKKATLYAPSAAEISRIFLEKGEIFQPGKPAVSLSVSSYKLQADVTELEIGKIRGSGNECLIKLDAFPGEEFLGKVTSIDPKEIVREGDKYYRVNVFFDSREKLIRFGMSADLIIRISSQKNALEIPEFAIIEKNDKKFVWLKKNGDAEEKEVKTGISDGEFIEIKEGLVEGETIIIPSE